MYVKQDLISHTLSFLELSNASACKVTEARSKEEEKRPRMFLSRDMLAGDSETTGRARRISLGPFAFYPSGVLLASGDAEDSLPYPPPLLDQLGS